MKDEADIKLKIYFNDPDLTSDECDEQARQLMAELRDMAEVEAVSLVSDPSPPQGSKAIGGNLAGWLMAETLKVQVRTNYKRPSERPRILSWHELSRLDGVLHLHLSAIGERP